MSTCSWLNQISKWLVEWGGAAKDSESFDNVCKIVNDMWAQGSAVVVTGIWRWNVDSVWRRATGSDLG